MTLESIASEAGVTPQAAYRYFGDVDDLILLAVRRVEASEHERLLGFMMVRDLDSEADLANAAVAFVIRAYLAMARLPAAIRYRIARDYHDVSYESLWTVAEIIHAQIARKYASSAGIDVLQLAAGLTAVVAVAKSYFLHDLSLLTRPDAQRVMVGIFLGALRSGRGSPPGAQ